MRDTTIIVGLGEILWDVFPDGPRLGGAPANFACSAASLSGRPHTCMVSAVGSDELGDRAINALIDKSVDTSGVIRVAQPTGQVFVELDQLGRARYEFDANAAWDNLTWSGTLAKLSANSDLCCFGTLGQRCEMSRETIRKFLARTPKASTRLFDVNLRPPFYSDRVILESLKLANVLKLNDEELPVVADLCGYSGAPIELMQKLAKRFELQCVALTCGSDGAVLVGKDSVSEQPSIATQLVDTVGAGDAFTAALAIGLLEGYDLDDINHRACSVAAFVCSQAGATPQIPAALAYR